MFLLQMKPLLSALSLLIFIAQFTDAYDTPEKWVQLHNEVRSKVGVGPLKWNAILVAYAANYSQLRSVDCLLTHSHGPYGENIYWGQGEGFTDPVAAMNSWVDEEIDYYNYSSNSCLDGKQCLHYTQVIWKNTAHLGCAVSKCSQAENKVILFCVKLLELFIKDYWCISLASSFQFSRTETLSRDSRTILGLEFLHDSHLICEYPKEDPAVESGIQKRESRTGCIVAEVVAVVGIVATEAVTVVIPKVEVPAADIKEAIDRSSGGGGSGRDGEWLCANPSCGTFQ